MNELEVILTDLLKCSRADLYLNAASNVFTGRELASIDKILKERAQAYPIQYILGHTEFMGLKFKVNRDVFIPRPETEILIETVIELSTDEHKIKRYKMSTDTNINLRPSVSSSSAPIGVNSNLKILDIGTGSGCIAVSLAKILQNADITAIDISEEALDLAKENSRLHKVQGKIKFLQSDLFSNSFFKAGIKFDIVVSNPPYVPTSEIGIFDKTTLKEPKVALDGGKDGLDFYRRIKKEAGTFLKKDGFLIMELGFAQAEKIKEIFQKGWVIERFKKDYQNIQRVCIIRKG